MHAVESGNGRPLKVGLCLPTWTTTALRWTEVLGIARAGAAVGFDSLWVTDHLVLPSSGGELRRRAGSDAAAGVVDEPEGYWECFSILAALAAEIPALELGSLVACTGYRSPALLAKIADTVDEISGGRFVLGVGAGDSEGEHLTHGFPFDHPVSRFEEALTIVQRLLQERRLDFHGRFYEVRECELVPRGPRPGGPPLMLGSLRPGPRMQRLIAQFADVWNGWLAYGDGWPEAVGPQMEVVDGACARFGRDPATLARTTAVRVVLSGSPYLPGPGERPLSGPPETLAEALRGHARAGVGHVVVALSPGDEAGVHAFAPVLELLDRG